MIRKLYRTRAGYILAVTSVLISTLVIGFGLGILACQALAADVELQPAPVEEVEVLVTEAPVAAPVEPPYTEEELELLALVIYQEAGGDACSDETRQMVGEVVLNRVADSRYPDNIHDVVTQRAQYGRLYWTGAVWPERAELPQEAHAVQRAYDCAEDLLTGTVDKLLPEDAVFQAEFVQGVETLAEADGFYFCR